MMERHGLPNREIRPMTQRRTVWRCTPSALASPPAEHRPGKPGPIWRAARRSWGYDTFVMQDHLGRQLSPLGGLAAAAAVTSRIRIGAFVFANDYRHPLLLARETATLDQISNGRVELGIGAGWKTSDYRQLGMPYERAGLRIERMQESVVLMRQLFTGERVTHSGRHYHLDGARLSPRPVQPSAVISATTTTASVLAPRLMAKEPAMGKRSILAASIGDLVEGMLRIAAREADIVGLLTQFDSHGRPIASQGTEAQTAHKVAIIRDAAGSREAFERLELNVLVASAGLIGSGSSPFGSVASAIKAAAPRMVGGTPYLLHGTLGQVRETLLRRRERLGISYYIWSARPAETMAPVVEALAGR